MNFDRLKKELPSQDSINNVLDKVSEKDNKYGRKG